MCSLGKCSSCTYQELIQHCVGWGSGRTGVSEVGCQPAQTVQDFGSATAFGRTATPSSTARRSAYDKFKIHSDGIGRPPPGMLVKRRGF
jgi:hypothetical protein